MNTDSDKPVYARAPRAPWREILRQRWSGRLDRALVLQDQGGAYHLGKRRHRHAPTYETAPFETSEMAEGSVGPRGKLRGYNRAFLVELDERTGTRPVALPTHHGAESVDMRVLWWVHDPVQAVRSRTTHGWLPVRKDIDRRLRHLEEVHEATGHGLSVLEMMPTLSMPHELADCGLTYRVNDISAREEVGELRLGAPGEATLAYSWNETSLEEYEFCKRAVQDGPASLAALWLVRHPDHVNQVLDWVVNHSDLLKGETDWQDQVAGMLGQLTAQEQQELSEMLRDRLVALGRHVPGQQTSEVRRHRTIHSRANGWPRTTVNRQQQ